MVPDTFQNEDEPIVRAVGFTKIQGEPTLVLIRTQGNRVLSMEFREDLEDADEYFRELKKC